MARNGSDDTTRRGTTGADAVEGLLAYAATRPRWSRGALRDLREAVARSRELAAADPAHTALLVRSLHTAATLLLKRGRAAEALPLAVEAVELSRPEGGAALVACLWCLSQVYEALQQYAEAAAATDEAAQAVPPDEA
ncbi:hypothetical protein [Nonomuraea sp. NPDC048916]|uniref:hypothetical protein n=1 Tax=Nonomuraea sp. NPDC048916 TaxID=3154232 RepID=UPI0033CBD6B5